MSRSKADVDGVGQLFDRWHDRRRHRDHIGDENREVLHDVEQIQLGPEFLGKGDSVR